jgi:DNA-directed RNA polymerase alpha subunit
MALVNQANAEVRDEVFDQFKSFLINTIIEIADSETRLSLANIQALLERETFLDLSEEEIFRLISENFHRFQEGLNAESSSHHGLHQIKGLSDDQRAKLERKEALVDHIDTPIDETGLSREIMDKLISSGVGTVGDLAGAHEEPLMYGADMTREEISDIKDFLSHRGLELNMGVFECRRYRT